MLLFVLDMAEISFVRQDEPGSDGDGSGDDNDGSDAQKSENKKKKKQGKKKQGKKKAEEKKVEREPEPEERLQRTVFIGNIPVGTKKKAVKKFCAAACGHDATSSDKNPVESVRFRSFAVAGTGMKSGSTVEQLRRACAITGKFEDGRDSLNAYVVMFEAEKAQELLKLDGTVWKERHLRVDTAIPSPPASFKRTVFVGGLPFDVNDEEVWALFSEKLEGGDKDIASVRLIRDKATNVGKVRARGLVARCAAALLPWPHDLISRASHCNMAHRALDTWC